MTSLKVGPEIETNTGERCVHYVAAWISKMNVKIFIYQPISGDNTVYTN